MDSLGQKLKMPKTSEKRFYKSIRVILFKNTAPKNTKYSRNETILKIGHFPKAIAFAKWSVWVKNEKCQEHGNNDSTRTLELFCAKKNTKYLRNETILKIDYFPKALAHAKAIVFERWSVWIKN